MRAEDAGEGFADGRGAHVLIAHDFAETYGGAERIVAAAAEALPGAPFWTIAGRQSVAERMGVANRFHSLLPERELLLRHYRLLAPLYPSIVRNRRLPAADVLLTSSYAFAHGFKTENDAPQVCFCYSPLRFLWSMTERYADRWAPGGLRSRGFNAMVRHMRRADRKAAERVTKYVAESKYVADQIARVYGREADVIHPPVDASVFTPSKEEGHDGYYLFCGRLIEPYKRPGIVVEAFRSLPHRLVVAGDGPAYAELRRNAPSNVEFVGHIDDEQLVPLMQRCAATIFPSVDDFGLIPIEVMACGRPVLAFAGGGALESVAAGKTGEFFREPTAFGLLEALQTFDPDGYDMREIRAHAEHWDVPRFQEQILRAVLEAASG
jgi:glycosyltransferase involved in cell wall biosynthesis